MAREVGKDRYKKAKSARTVDISQTAWKKDTGAGPKGKAGRLVGPAGKLFTGKVKMQDGSTAVYEKGKRVAKKTTAGGGVTKSQAAASRKAAQSKPAATSKKSTTPSASTSTSKRTETKSTSNRNGSEGPKRSVKRTGAPRTQTVQVPGGVTIKLGGNSKPQPKDTSKPKVGTRRRRGAYGGYEVWNGTRWVQEKK